MSKVKLKHSSGNSMSIAAPATNPASDLELKLPATIGTAGQVLKNSSTPGTLEFGAAGGGKILQIVQHISDSYDTISSNGSFSIMSDMEATITTTAADSDIYLLIDMAGYSDNTNGDMSWQVKRKIGSGSYALIDENSTSQGSRSPGIVGNYRGDFTGHGGRWQWHYVDNPGSNAAGTAIKYAPYIQTESQNWVRNHSNQNASRMTYNQSHIIMMEIAA